LLGGNDDVLDEVLQASLPRPLADGVGHLALKISISVHDVPTLRHSTWILRLSRCSRALPGRPAPVDQPPNPRTKLTSQPRTWSVTRKKIAASVTMTRTAAVVTHTSLRPGHVTFAVSWRTS